MGRTRHVFRRAIGVSRGQCPLAYLDGELGSRIGFGERENCRLRFTVPLTVLGRFISPALRDDIDRRALLVFFFCAMALGAALSLAGLALKAKNLLREGRYHGDDCLF